MRGLCTCGRGPGFYRDGHYTNSAVARAMIEVGFGLSEKQIEEWYRAVDRLRQPKPKGSYVDDLRRAIEFKQR